MLTAILVIISLQLLVTLSLLAAVKELTQALTPRGNIHRVTNTPG